jgi:hypothetical protein
VSTSPQLAPLPDAERLVAAFLREDARITALIGVDRVYTAFPAKAGTSALLLVQRIGGIPPLSVPLVFDEAELQLDAYGGPKSAAHELAATARAVLTELEGAVRPEGVCSAVRFGALRYLPDETFSPPRPRYLFDATFTVRTPAVPGARLTGRASAVTEPGELPLEPAGATHSRPERGT